MIYPRPYEKHVSPAEAIADSKFFRDYQSAFVTASGHTLILLNPDGTEPLARSTRSKKTGKTRTPEPKVDGCRMVPVHYGNRVLALLVFAPARCSTSAESHLGSTTRNLSDKAGVSSTNGDSSAASAVTPVQWESFFRMLEFFALQLADWFVRHASSRTLRERPRLVRMMEWLEAHFHEPVTLTEAAKAVGLSPWTFSSNFHELSGMNFRDALCQIRISHAKRLLADPRIMNHQVAAAVGFRSISQFNRVFRGLVGCTAGEFRRKLETALPGSSAGTPAIRPVDTAVVLRPSFTPMNEALSSRDQQPTPSTS